MRLTSYLLFLALCVLIGICSVHAVVVSTRAEYRMAALIQQEEALRRDLARLQAELAVLTSPERLERLNRELHLGFVPLTPQAGSFVLPGMDVPVDGRMSQLASPSSPEGPWR